MFRGQHEGINDPGFAGLISRNYWPDLAYIGECKLGTSLTHEKDGVTYHALVCHSLQVDSCDRVEVKGDVCGVLEAGGAVVVHGNALNKVDAGGSVHCGDVSGDVDAGGSVTCGNVSGSVDAGGFVIRR